MGGKELCELKVSISKLRQNACEGDNEHFAGNYNKSSNYQITDILERFQMK